MAKPTKTNYSELEAAQELGVTIEQLRELIRLHITREDGDSPYPQSFQPSDLIVLRILADTAQLAGAVS